jgi:hypothetical protein
MDSLRLHVLAALKGGLAYDTFDSIVAEFGAGERGLVPRGAEVSAWQILEHMRFCLRDILEFTENEDGSYVEPDWPAAYWSSDPLPSAEAWDATIQAYKDDLRRMEELVSDPSRDLFEPFPWAPDYTLLREALLVADHAAYHLGQLVELKRWVQAQA